ncbi:spore cortex biosynthesis protein YabQ [Paenibacillus mucilaginosus]|uniref:Spore cortex biosynthesis protein YabQ n=3 Tax=Paenibacillus mucilaginosus TaxID=61624 RepID=H6NSF8_9BACL|nr:spore cortex biosynthesis protein YabQ [Paenibacillus mucilaginosus]AEI46077.1 spore cortex biosynthesis protein YabQ [Paenibacillus mucilaginosus KNP414]AFC33708.1 spore cortex biosynthesis protein YabQ [Paenibacillus mucilaginosus 3016]AFH66042.1 spore cortex biosynthesis protein YabQ [Paenibacillus mucilaginosus K02]WDM27421.1 spore cortex biosynthesis protein YabQ [Paenibacillus mucilaginosus]WFA22109.1 spore cortex biosynthesis protein YabQ [Paenibacillus mucilaginosus]
MTLSVQFLTMGMMYAGGLALGGLYDLYRVLSGQLKVPSWLRAALDLLYWFIGTLVVFALLYRSNWGEVRPFIFLGLAIGILFYFLVFSRPVIRVIVFTIRAVVTAARIGRRMIDLFIIRPAIGLYRLVLIILGFLLATAIFIYKIVLQLLYPAWRLLLWLFRPLGRWMRLHVAVPAGMKTIGQKLKALFRKLF